ncbi:Serine/threonine-protein kinase StkP [Rubripirellula tenax]|uniref:non-specific serine/threonine protein kinase n=1 Tax=Rubripirellula tenax TaxID=2528015 RepID=A0A5C6EPW8_9BACT|nr:serine/threonine-protein kinase [Rubripirellula tenax]TWU50958.1 Serine/threonine-protein kinase StkP [Rubripirellula tenax]
MKELPENELHFVAKEDDSESSRKTSAFIANDFFSEEDNLGGRAGTDESPPAAPEIAGQVIGGYRIVREIGRGGMGVVYLANHIGLDRDVALKVISRGQFANDLDRKRFAAEGRAVARLDHPLIASVYEVGEDNGHQFMAMQFIAGHSLNECVATRSFSPTEAARIARDIATAMAYAHGKGVIHRDLKPSNVMLDDNGSVHVLDFGLAKAIGHDETMTRSGQIMGTPAFMSPEQAGGMSKAVGPEADIYAIGATLYQLLTGQPPFRGDSVLKTLEMVRLQPAPSLRSSNRNIPTDLSIVCGVCLQKSPDDRYRSAGDLAEDLDRFLNHRPILAKPTPLRIRLMRWCQRNPLPTIFMASVTGLLALVSNLYFEATANAERARLSHRKQVQTINELFVEIGSSDLRNVPNSHTVRRELLQKANAFYTEASNRDEVYGDLDELMIQAKTQMASLLGELAKSETERDAAIRDLEASATRLRDIVTNPKSVSTSSVHETIETYAITPEAKKAWANMSGTINDDLLIETARLSSLTDNLTIQIGLWRSNPSKQVELARQAVKIREQLVKRVPGSEWFLRRHAGALHNLATATRALAMRGNSLELLIESLETIKKSQAIRETLMEIDDKEKLRLELAKGYYETAAIESEIALHDPGESVDIAGAIKSYQHAAEIFKSLSKSQNLSLEADFQAAITLREMTLCRQNASLEAALPLGTVERASCRFDIIGACEILNRLRAQNPAITRYAHEYFYSRAIYFSLVEKDFMQTKTGEGVEPRWSLESQKIDAELRQSFALYRDSSPNETDWLLQFAREAILYAYKANDFARAIEWSRRHKIEMDRYGQQISDEAREDFEMLHDALEQQLGGV